jgi:hypothetical protein
LKIRTRENDHIARALTLKSLSWQSKKMIDLFPEGQNWFLSKEVWVRPMSSNATVTSGPVSVLHGEIDSIQISLKLLFTSQQ